MALISRWFEPALRGRAIGMVVIGNGLGIILGGHLVPLLNGLGRGWQLSWQVFGASVLAVAVICWLLLRNEPGGEEDYLLRTARQKRGGNIREIPTAALTGACSGALQPSTSCSVLPTLFTPRFLSLRSFSSVASASRGRVWSGPGSVC